MNRTELAELHYITPIVNVPSIIAKGILCHRSAARVRHESVAMADIQEKRAGKTVPGGRPLHEYVNLYLHARNVMLYKCRGLHQGLAVLRVSTDVLDLPDVVIANGNAASAYTRFMASPDGLSKVDAAMLFAEYWTDPDPIEQWRKKSAKCAEVLVPDRVDPRFIMGGYVSCAESQRTLEATGSHLTTTVDGHLFFM